MSNVHFNIGMCDTVCKHTRSHANLSVQCVEVYRYAQTHSANLRGNIPTDFTIKNKPYLFSFHKATLVLNTVVTVVEHPKCSSWHTPQFFLFYNLGHIWVSGIDLVSTLFCSTHSNNTYKFEMLTFNSIP